MVSLGVTGAMASGKTDVAARLASHGALRIEGDALGWEVLQELHVREGLRRRFGDSIVASDGTVDRTRLGAIVFRDPKAMDSLNALVQPLLEERVRSALRAAHGERVVVLDAALLTAWKLEPELDGVIEVFAPAETRIQRLVAKGLGPDEARARVSGQTLPPVRGARRYWRIDNTRTPADLAARVDEIWREIERLRPEARSG